MLQKSLKVLSEVWLFWSPSQRNARAHLKLEHAYELDETSMTKLLWTPNRRPHIPNQLFAHKGNWRRRPTSKQRWDCEVLHVMVNNLVQYFHLFFLLGKPRNCKSIVSTLNLKALMYHIATWTRIGKGQLSYLFKAIGEGWPTYFEEQILDWESELEECEVDE